MKRFTNFKELTMYLQGTTYGKEAISNFLFSMYNVELANQCSNTSTLVIVDSEYEKSNVTTTLCNPSKFLLPVLKCRYQYPKKN